MPFCMDAETFDWNHARAFLAAAEQGSFSAAALALGVAQPTVGRQVAALEEELGVTLFERVGRGLQLTAVGLDLAEHVRAMRDAAQRASLTAAGESLSLEGVVCITASEFVAAYVLPPIVGRIREAHPGIELELVGFVVELVLRWLGRRRIERRRRWRRGRRRRLTPRLTARRDSLRLVGAGLLGDHDAPFLVDADDLVPELGHAGRVDGTEVAAADDGDAHGCPPGRRRCVPPT